MSTAWIVVEGLEAKACMKLWPIPEPAPVMTMVGIV